MVPALGQRLGELPPPQSTDPDTERYLLYAAAVGLLEEASRPASGASSCSTTCTGPTSRASSCSATSWPTPRLPRLLIFGTYRDAELSASHPLTEALGGLLREPRRLVTASEGTRRHRGHRLHGGGRRARARRRRGGTGPSALPGDRRQSRSSWPRCCATCRSRATIYQDASTGRWTADDTEGQLALPHSVRAVIGSRLARLGDEATKVLSTASVIGRDFDLDLSAATTRVGRGRAHRPPRPGPARRPRH